MQQQDAVSRLVESGFPLGTIETGAPWRIEALFRRHERATGEAIYIWERRRGLYRIGTEYIRIPHTETLGRTLAFVASTIHYGVYVIVGMGEALREEAVVERLRRFARSQDRVRRMMVFVDRRIPEVRELSGLTMRLRHDVRKAS
ncbi:MAG: hypothetical protein PVG98_03270 [Chromatiales bacterium]|jgi:hypothetical protein